VIAEPHPTGYATPPHNPQIIKQQIAEGVSMRRVGLVSSGAPARQHCEVSGTPALLFDFFV
jgi:hypothetical protein